MRQTTTATEVSKADIHIHSKYSDRPSEWFLRRIGAPESYVESVELYQRVKERGMDFVTISDHNSIDGALQIAHLSNAFISAEVTTYFPEDQCKVHCLVLGISEGLFREIQARRSNIYDLQEYLREQNIIHSIAHPLYRARTIDTMARIANQMGQPITVITCLDVPVDVDYPYKNLSPGRS